MEGYGERERGEGRKGWRGKETIPVCVGPTLLNYGNTSLCYYIISISDVEEIELGVERSAGALELRGALRALCELYLLWREKGRVREAREGGREGGREAEREGGRWRESAMLTYQLH